MKHSLFGFSCLERRYLCPGSYRLEKDLRELPPAEKVPPGKLMHLQIESMIKSDILKNQVTVDERFTPDETEAIKFCFNQYHAIASDPVTDWKFVTEKSFNFSEIIPQIEVSTCDFIAYVPFKTAHVFDWKFNYLDIEEADNNIQLAGYALGAFMEYDVKKVVVYLVEAFAKRVTSYVYSREDQNDIISFTKTIINNCFKSFAPLVPGKKQCAYCRANTPNHCPKILESMFDSELKTPISEMAAIDVSRLLDAVELNMSICGKIKQYAYACMIQGAKIPNYYLDKGRNSRSWKKGVCEEDLKKVGTLLGKEISGLTKNELLSIQEIEKKWGKSVQVKKELEALIHKEEGKPLLKRE